MLLQTTDRVTAIEYVMNLCLKDPKKYCNNCDTDYTGKICCDDPQIGSSMDHARALILDNERIKQNLLHETGKSEGGNMRMAFRLPPRIYHTIQLFFKKYDEKFPKDVAELHALMKRFNKFCAVEKI